MLLEASQRLWTSAQDVRLATVVASTHSMEKAIPDLGVPESIGFVQSAAPHYQWKVLLLL